MSEEQNTSDPDLPPLPEEFNDVPPSAQEEEAADISPLSMSFRNEVASAAVPPCAPHSTAGGNSMWMVFLIVLLVMWTIFGVFHVWENVQAADEATLNASLNAKAEEAEKRDEAKCREHYERIAALVKPVHSLKEEIEGKEAELQQLREAAKEDIAMKSRNIDELESKIKEADVRVAEIEKKLR